VDDAWEGHENLPLALDGIPSGEVIILLAHEPDFADQVVNDGRVSLQLSGHTHGGQVRIPGLPAITTPRLGHKYTDGLYALGDLQLYVTRGVGVVFPPVRLFCRPEITFITLVGE
jgi:predicted MPP superfamily phosphohydrolase